MIISIKTSIKCNKLIYFKTATCAITKTGSLDLSISYIIGSTLWITSKNDSPLGYLNSSGLAFLSFIYFGYFAAISFTVKPSHIP